MIALIAVVSAFALRAPDLLYTQAWHGTAVPGARGEVEIDDLYGDVTVEAGAPGQVRIDATESAPSAADLTGVDVHVDTIEGAVKISTDFPPEWSGLRRTTRSVDYDIRVPAGTKLVLRLKYGDARVDGVGGPTDAQSRYGDVEIRGASGDSDVSSVYGDVTLSVASTDPEARIAIRTTYGDVTVELPKSASPHVSARTRVGSVTNEFDAGTAPGPMLELKTTFGSIRIRGKGGS